MGRGVENSLNSVDWISDDDDLGDIIIGCGLIDAASNSKQFGFSTGDKCSMMEGLDEWLIGNVRVWDGSSNVIFDASIWYNDGYGLRGRGINNQRVELSWWMWNLSFFPFMHKLKENISEKMSMIQELGKSSGWVGKNTGKSLWDLLLVSTRWPLMFLLWWSVKLHKEEGCWFCRDLNEESMSVQIIWFKGVDTACNCALPPSFWRWNLMEMRPTIASIPSEEDVLNTPSI